MLTFPRSRFEQAVEVAAGAGILLSFGLVACYLPQLPDQIPTHFEWGGRADDWGPKATLLIFPAVSAFVYGLLTVLSLWPDAFRQGESLPEEEFRRRFLTVRGMMACLKAETVWLLVVLTWAAIRVGLGRADRLNEGVLAFIVVAIIGTTAWYVWRMLRQRHRTSRGP